MLRVTAQEPGTGTSPADSIASPTPPPPSQCDNENLSVDSIQLAHVDTIATLEGLRSQAWTTAVSVEQSLWGNLKSLQPLSRRLGLKDTECV